MDENLSLEEQIKLQRELKTDIKRRIKSLEAGIDIDILSFFNGYIKDNLFEVISEKQKKIHVYKKYLVILDEAQKQTMKKILREYIFKTTDKVKTVSKNVINMFKRELSYIKSDNEGSGFLIVNVSQDKVLTAPIYKKKKFRIKSYTDNLLKLDNLSTEVMNKLDKFFSPFKGILSVNEESIGTLEKQNVNLSRSTVGTYDSNVIDNFIYLLNEKDKRRLANKVINDNQVEDVVVKKRKKNLGYVNFYLIFIATLFLSLLSILLGFQILGF